MVSPASKSNDFARVLLARTFEKRRSRNSAYSMRAFARDLGVSPSWLSELLKGEKGMSAQRADDLADALGLSERQRQRFVNSAAAMYGRSRAAREDAATKIDSRLTQNHYLDVNRSAWEVVASWRNYGILELLKMPDGPTTAEGLAECLGLTRGDVEQCLSHLQRCHLVSTHRGRWRISAEHTSIPSVEGGHSAIRAFHNEMLQEASRALRDRPATERVSCGLVLSVDNRTVPLIQERFEQFIRALDAEVDDTCERKDTVFGLTLHAFPLSRTIK